MIDIHCHILPEVDDGARDLIESIGMAKHAVGQGISTIFATPHYIQGRYENEGPDIIKKVRIINKHLNNKNIPLTILPGQEPRIYGTLYEDYKAGKILTLNNSHKYMLIELPDSHVPAYTEKLLFNIQLDGIIPVIVHPERNVQIRENPDILYQFILNGATSQITASSLVDDYDKKKQRLSLQLIEHHLAHFIASDSHRLSRRSFKLNKAFEAIEDNLDSDYVQLLKSNTQTIIKGKALLSESPQRINHKWF